MFEFTLLDGDIDNWGLVYNPIDYAFAVPDGSLGGDGLTLLVNDLNLNLNCHGDIDGIWGLCPHPSWGVTKLVIPDFVNAQLKYALFRNLVPGVSHRLNPENRWTVKADPTSGWVCIDGNGYSDVSVRVAQEVIIELRTDGSIVRLWLKPIALPQL